MRVSTIAFLLVMVAVGCSSATTTEPHSTHHWEHTAHGDEPTTVDVQLLEVARIHGAAGPWAVAGYRMGRHALKQLGLKPQSFDLEVIHHSPQQVQFSCIADGAAAATGASIGKLNLRLEPSDAQHVTTTYVRTSTKVMVILRPTAEFQAKFRDVPREKLGEAGRLVMSLSDAEIFEEVNEK